ncbi:MAG: MmgE/PrpD family protein, partial [Burkholderiales bacterium]|nr:MmgE/PrpD family protein [Burkholderiales bacterium]
MADAATSRPREITREIAAYAANTRFEALPDNVRAEGARAFLNWMGCALGGCRDPAVQIAVETVAEAGSSPQASLIGHGRKADVASAAFVNCLSSTVLSFDDTHLATVTHPTGPVAASIFALAEKHDVSGEDFVTALALGIEIECRMSNVLLLPPARAQVGWFVTGITGPIGAAVALGRLLRLDETKMRAAIGLAAAQASGFRGTHGAMSAFLVPAHAARCGVSGALLAAKGITCPDNVLEGPKGFVDVFGTGGDLNRAVDGLGDHFELFANAYKPYPSGIVVQAAIDACLDIAQKLPPEAAFKTVALTVHPMALELCYRRDPANPVEAQISLFHWAAACLIERSAGLAQLSQGCIDGQEIAALRALITANADHALGRDEAIAEVKLADGKVLRSHVPHAR